MKSPFEIVNALLDLIYPRVCPGCGHNLFRFERILCFSCLSTLPKTGLHRQVESPLLSLFAARSSVQAVSAFLYFRPYSVTRSLLHHLKYQQGQEIGEELGRLYAEDLANSNFVHQLDCIVPVPLHASKQKLRGYNQSEAFARGLAGRLSLPVETNLLIRTRETNTQTRKSRAERVKNVSTAFECRLPSGPTPREILLVDDVLTTGATLDACVQELEKIPGCSIRIATLAYAQ